MYLFVFNSASFIQINLYIFKFVYFYIVYISFSTHKFFISEYIKYQIKYEAFKYFVIILFPFYLYFSSTNLSHEYRLEQKLITVTTTSTSEG